MKYFRMSYKEVTEERSYLNILLLNASIPQYHDGKKPNKKKEKEPETATEYFLGMFKK